MKLDAATLSVLRVPLAALAVAVVVGGALVYGTRAVIAQEKRALAQDEARMKEALGRYQRSGEERDLIVRYLEPFRQLQTTGLIGPEQRINWLDAMRIANQQLGLFGADYQISTQQPYPFAQELNAQRLGLAQSVMKLNLKLAHEGELMRFLRLLEAQRVGVFDVNQCVLERTTGTSAGRPLLQANLNAACELAWITINPETPPERKP